MTSYYTRAKARGEIEQEDVEQGDSALETTTVDIRYREGLVGQRALFPFGGKKDVSYPS